MAEVEGMSTICSRRSQFSADEMLAMSSAPGESPFLYLACSARGTSSIFPAPAELAPAPRRPTSAIPPQPPLPLV